MACVSVWGQVRRWLSHEGSRYFSSHALELLLTKQSRRANRRANIYSPSIDWAFPASVHALASATSCPRQHVTVWPQPSGSRLQFQEELSHSFIPVWRGIQLFLCRIDSRPLPAQTVSFLEQPNQFSRFVNWWKAVSKSRSKQARC